MVNTKKSIEERRRQADQRVIDAKNHAAALANLETQHNNRRLIKIAKAALKAAEKEPAIEQLIAMVDLEILAEEENKAKAKAEGKKSATTPPSSTATDGLPATDGDGSDAHE